MAGNRRFVFISSAQNNYIMRLQFSKLLLYFLYCMAAVGLITSHFLAGAQFRLWILITSLLISAAMIIQGSSLRALGSEKYGVVFVVAGILLSIVASMFWFVKR